MTKKVKLLDDKISDVIDDIDQTSTVLERIQNDAHELQEEIDELRLLKKDLEKDNKRLEKEVQKLKTIRG